MLRESGVGYWPLRTPIVIAPASSLGPSSIHILSPILTPLGRELESSNREKNKIERARRLEM